jgi:hypothetical protein
MTEWCGEDLAYIHDVGHADFALESAPGILDIFVRSGIQEGLVVDLGCGSGLWHDDQNGAREGARSCVSGRIAVRGRHPCVRRRHGGQRSPQLPVRHGERRPGTHQAIPLRVPSAGSRRRLCLRCRRARAGPSGDMTRGVFRGQRLGGTRRNGGGRGAEDVDPPDRQLPEDGGILRAGRRSAPFAVIQAVGDRRRIASSGLPGPDDARLRLLPSAEGSRGVRRAQTGVRER